ncbi:MAG: hypothetical protein ACK5LF_15905 [Bacteroides xylanisolvens]
MNLRTRIICILNVLFLLVNFSSDAIGQEFINSFFKVQRSLQQEKLYIHVDKPYYTVGDTVWFRGTLVNADTHSLVVKTNFIYVELYGQDSKKPILRKKLKRDNLCFHNNFILPDTLRAGKYTLQAYTNWMRNFSKDNFFSRSFNIVNMGNSIPIEEKKKIKRDYEVTFMPEGGNLLAGKKQRIAFIVQGSDGYSESVDGKVADSRGNVLAKFTTVHNGMGSFFLNAPVDEVLKVFVTAHKDGLQKEFILPVAMKQGVALSVTVQKSKLVYKVLGHSEVPLSLIIHSRGNVIKVLKLDQKMNEGEIPTISFPDGIIQVLLCNANGNALSRRLVFIRNKGKERWIATHEQALTSKREKVIIDLELSDNGHPLRGDFSVSVIDAGQVAVNSSSDNIVSNLLLTSELKGYIEDPGWYFDNMNEHKQELLDLVMLTHGWSRFATDHIVAVPELPKLDYKLEVGQYISGRVDGLSDKEKDVQISIMDANNGSFVSGKLNKDGSFYFDGVEYPDSLLMKARLFTKDKRAVRIRFDRYVFPEVYRKDPKDFPRLKSSDDNYQSGQIITADGVKLVELPEVTVEKKTRRSSILGNVWVDSIWDFDEKRLKEEFGGNLNRTANSIVGDIRKNRGWLDGIVTVIVNDIPYTDRQVLLDINADDISRMTFIRKDYNTFASQREGGAVVITLKSGASMYKTMPDQRMVSFSLIGYAWPEYFYHPVYDTPEKKKYEMLDMRSTIYWNPSIQTDETGHRKIAFYTSDRPGNYHIIIEGVTIDGRPIWYSHSL